MYTDKWFKFPVRVCDIDSYEEWLHNKHMAEKEGEQWDESVKFDWILGEVEVDPNDIVLIRDSFDHIYGYNETVDGGYKMTWVVTKYTEHHSVWSKEKFKEELNKFVENANIALEKK